MCADAQARSILTEYGGEIKSSEEAKKMNPSHHTSLRDGSGRVLVGFSDPALAAMSCNSSFGSFVNCCDGDTNRVNCFLAVVVFRTMRVRVFLVANQFIPNGTALCLNYGRRATATHHL